MNIAIALLLLAASSGVMDAFAFLQLGGIFTANMTGNLVLMGLFSRPLWIPTLLGAMAAVASFAGATLLGFRMTRNKPGAHTGSADGVLRVAAIGCALQVLIAAVWPLFAESPPLVWTIGFVAASAASLGFQTVIAKRMSGPSGVTTTFVTGTLTSAMQDFAEGRRGSRGIRLLIIAALTAGAFAGAACVLLAPALVPSLSLVLMLAAVALIAWMPGTPTN